MRSDTYEAIYFRYVKIAVVIMAQNLKSEIEEIK